MSYYGGTNQEGVVFKIKPDGTGYSMFLDFMGTGGVFGREPKNSFISDGTFLYGMVRFGGTGTCNGGFGCGTILKIKPDGTGVTNLFNFSGTSTGQGPYGDLIFVEPFLYGMTTSGGTNDTIFGGKGTIFKIKTDGTAYSKLYDFGGTNDGKIPWGSLISDGTFIYGMASSGGDNTSGCGSSDGCGVIFKIKQDGTGYSNLLDFAGSTNGKYPTGSLISVGSFIYGMTMYGGINDMGVLFKIKSDGTAYTKLLDFAGASNGSHPEGSLISDGFFLYGMTGRGGANDNGVIFKYQISPSGITENNMIPPLYIYPNPNAGIFRIEMNELQKKVQCSVSIYNVLGENIYQSEIKNQMQEIDLSKHPNGIYFINYKTENGTTIQKIIINK